MLQRSRNKTGSKEYIALRNKKIEEAKLNPEHIFTVCQKLTLTDGFLELNPIRFMKYNREEANYFKKHVSMLECNDRWLRSFWRLSPEASLADALRCHLGLDTPESEASFMMGLQKGNSSSARVVLLNDNSHCNSWKQYFTLRGSGFLKKKYEVAFQMDAVRFSEICKSTVAELVSLGSMHEIEALQAIQSVMRDVLCEGVQSPDIKGEGRRRVEEAIKTLDAALDESTPEVFRPQESFAASVAVGLEAENAESANFELQSCVENSDASVLEEPLNCLPRLPLDQEEEALIQGLIATYKVKPTTIMRALKRIITNRTDDLAKYSEEDQKRFIERFKRSKSFNKVWEEAKNRALKRVI